jgi:hypothetical protein
LGELAAGWFYFYGECFDTDLDAISVSGNNMLQGPNGPPYLSKQAYTDYLKE